ncbi:type I 3-dehydroquinate dehydratase [archaeon]|nr:type I 3-dehydroquinate dehydratase [archaeon]
MICIPITARKINDALEQIKEASKDADIIELRLDYLKELSENDLKRLLKAGKKPVICTCRKIEEGGLFKGTESKRIGVLKKAMKLKTDYIDLEYGTSKVNKKKIHEYNHGNQCQRQPAPPNPGQATPQQKSIYQ